MWWGGRGQSLHSLRFEHYTGWEADTHESQHRHASSGSLRLSPGLRVRVRGRTLHVMRGGNASKRSTWKPPHARAVITKRLRADMMQSFVRGGLRTWANACPTSVCAWHACAAHDGDSENRSIASRVFLVLPKYVVGRAWTVAAHAAWRAHHWLGHPTHTNRNSAALRATSSLLIRQQFDMACPPHPPTMASPTAAPAVRAAHVVR